MKMYVHSTKTLRPWEKGAMIFRSGELAKAVVIAQEEVGRPFKAIYVENRSEYSEFVAWATVKKYVVRILPC